MGEKKLINIRLDSDLWHLTKVEAAKQNKSLQDFVTEALQVKIGQPPCQTK